MRMGPTTAGDVLMSESKHAIAPLDPAQLQCDARAYAKNLLKHMAAGAPTAVSHFEKFHPRHEQAKAAPKLADAQLVTARMLGYTSWPALKHHRERMAQHRRDIDEGAPAPDGDRSTVHIRCGSDIAEGLRRAGYEGAFLEFADPVCHGPVPAGDDETRRSVRASFIASAYELPLSDCVSRMRREQQALDNVGRYDRVVLWFEHDSYDQLILAQVLSVLAELSLPDVQLICIDAYPGKPGFRGLGELPEVSLRGLWETRRRVGPEDYALGRAVWAALQREDPRPLYAIARTGTVPIPPMAGALERHAMELPWTSDGLSLTQRQLLEVIQAGAVRCGAAFRVLTTTVEPLPFLGDAMVWWEMRELAAGGAVTLQPSDESWPRWGIGLTALGTALLAHNADWVDQGRRERWVGGVPCGPEHPQWRWDPVREQPVLVSRG